MSNSAIDFLQSQPLRQLFEQRHLLSPERARHKEGIVWRRTTTVVCTLRGACYIPIQRKKVGLESSEKTEKGQELRDEKIEKGGCWKLKQRRILANMSWFLGIKLHTTTAAVQLLRAGLTQS